MERCGWVTKEPIYIDYHDLEWGRPVFDDGKLFEMLILEGAQAGLSWITILKRRENYRQAFDHFDFEKIAQYDETKIQELLNNPGIIRNRKKILSAIGNARCFMEIRDTYGSFSNYLWGFVDGKPIVNQWKSLAELPAETPLSQRISRDLKKRGFSFVGPTIIYSYLQAIGVVNDHLISCFCHPFNQK